jgi:hypothetical protein
VVSFTPRPLYSQGNSPWYPLDRSLGGPQSRSDMVSKRKIPTPWRESNSLHPIFQPVASRYTTEPFRFAMAKRKTPCLCRESNRGSPFRNLATIPTEFLVHLDKSATTAAVVGVGGRRTRWNVQRPYWSGPVWKLALPRNAK